MLLNESPQWFQVLLSSCVRPPSSIQKRPVRRTSHQRILEQSGLRFLLLVTWLDPMVNTFVIRSARHSVPPHTRCLPIRQASFPNQSLRIPWSLNPMGTRSRFSTSVISTWILDMTWVKRPIVPAISAVDHLNQAALLNPSRFRPLSMGRSHVILLTFSEYQLWNQSVPSREPLRVMEETLPGQSTLVIWSHTTVRINYPATILRTPNIQSIPCSITTLQVDQSFPC